MDKASANRIILVAFSVVALTATTIGAAYWGSSREQRQQLALCKENESAKLYQNIQMGFSLNYPSWVTDIQESSNKVIFTIKDVQDQTGFGVLGERTTSNTTKDWLARQPKGSAVAEGYEPILWRGDTVLVANYVVVDHDGKSPIYGKQLWAVAVGNGKLYKINCSFELGADATPRVDAEMMKIIASFHIIDTDR